MDEYWKECPINTKYECSNTGKIRNKKTLRILKSFDCHGYRYLRLGSKYKNSVHRIIGYTFLNLTDDLEIDHINRDRSDNRLENLRVVNRSQNGMNRDTKNYRIQKVNGYTYYEVSMTLKYGEQRFIERYKTEEEAIKKVNELKLLYRVIS